MLSFEKCSLLGRWAAATSISALAGSVRWRIEMRAFSRTGVKKFAWKATKKVMLWHRPGQSS
jgi:hypothetical protein